MTNSERIWEEAAVWLARQKDDAMDWDGLTAWLEADPRHREAFDEVSLIDADLNEHRDAIWNVEQTAVPTAANDARWTQWGRWAGWAGGAVAAGVALVLALQPEPNGVPMQDYRASARKSAEIALADGTQITLAPASHLTVQGEKLALAGTGYFEVLHKPGRTLVVRAGDFEVSDIGTRFSIGNEADGVRVEVAEGTVAVASARMAKRISLSAGHGLIADTAGGTVRLTQIQPTAVASWRTGKLQFDQMPLALVARDVSRYSGYKVTVDPVIADRPFSGVIAIDDGGSPGATLAQILALDARPVEGGVRLEPRR